MTDDKMLSKVLECLSHTTQQPCVLDSSSWTRRVLTAALVAASEQHGVELVALDPARPQQWTDERVDVIVHKVAGDSELDARLEAFRDAHPELVLLDPPAAVRALQHREAMLAPLAGQPLLLKQCEKCSAAGGLHDKCQQQIQPHSGRESRQQPHANMHQQPQQADNYQQQGQLQQQTCQTCVISTPAQVTLHPGCCCDQALLQLAHAGIQLPALVKPLTSAPTDAPSAAAAASHVDGHALGAVFDEQGVQQLLQGALPELALPVVVQQFVPHGEALYKLYVIGPHVVLTRRSTLTLQQLHAARAAAAGDAGIVLLQRVSAVPLPSPANSNTSHEKVQQIAAADKGTVKCMLQPGSPACATSTASCTAGGTSLERKLTQQQQQQGEHRQVVDTAEETRCCDCSLAGVALADASVAGDPDAPPLLAMQQLAAYLGQTLQLSLFNVDIIAPKGGPTGLQQQTQVVPMAFTAVGVGEPNVIQVCSLSEEAAQGDTTSTDSSRSPQQFLVVDVNFFPGYDKVPGAEQLFADYLASLKQGFCGS